MKKILILLLVAITFACSKSEKDNASDIITVKAEPLTSLLFYTGTVLPKKNLVVTTPAEGVVVDMPFQYGEVVKKGQLLFVISSAKFIADYKTGLLAYIKAKNEFGTAQTQLSEADFLHKNQLISDDEYKTKQSNYYTAQLGLIQARDTLDTLLQQLQIKNVDLYKLTIADVDKITKAMHLQMTSENLRIFSPANGTILSPPKSEEENKKIVKGDAVKQGDVLGVIGNMDGISVRIKVNELIVNQLKVGQKVKVSGIAFPEYELQGEIRRIDKQGESSSGGLPTFYAEVVVPSLTAAQQKIIHVGMSAKVEISAEEEPHIAIPVAAIKDKNGATFVTVFDPKTKKTSEREVQTGKTSATAVAILAGLNPGEKILVTH